MGDAAHAMMPSTFYTRLGVTIEFIGDSESSLALGQGAAQAVEDAGTLGVLFPLGTKPDEVPDRLALYQKARKSRAEALQKYSLDGILAHDSRLTPGG